MRWNSLVAGRPALLDLEGTLDLHLRLPFLEIDLEHVATDEE